MIKAIKTANKCSDPRVFAEIFIGDHRIKGLLDTGASVSLLGKRCRELIDKLGISIKPIFSVVSTADGKEHRLLGNIEIEISYTNQTSKIEFYLCPDLEQEAYLGIDFWKIFNLAREIFKIKELNIEKLQEDFRIADHRLQPHVLSEEQQQK